MMIDRLDETNCSALPTLLSKVLVATIIEIDNEFERDMALAMASSAGNTRRWPLSLVMWSNFLRFVTEEGTTVAQLLRLAHTVKSSFAGMERWGYITVEPIPKLIRPLSVIRPTAAGLTARRVWQPLHAVIENRWRTRFGVEEIDRLRQSLLNLLRHFAVSLTGCLQVPEWTYRGRRDTAERLPTEPSHYTPASTEAIAAIEQPAPVRDPVQRPQAPTLGNIEVAHELNLPALLSQVLIVFITDFERESELSLALCANVVRLLGGKAVPVRDLPRLSGVSKEVIAMSLRFLEPQGYVVTDSGPAGTSMKMVRLNGKGLKAQREYRELLVLVEDHWIARYGEDLRNLRESLERLVGDPGAESSPLFRGLEPYPDGWRAPVPKPRTLPHHPVVLLHRGGYPDGS